MLTGERVAQFKRDGFLLGDKVLSDEAVDHLNDEVARVIRDREQGGRQPVLCHNFARAQGQTVWQIVNIWEASEAFHSGSSPSKSHATTLPRSNSFHSGPETQQQVAIGTAQPQKLNSPVG